MSRQVRWWTEPRGSATSTWHRVAANPPRDTASTRRATGSGDDCVDGLLEDVDGDPGAEQRAQQHVAARPGRGVDPEHGHEVAGAVCRATRAANTPAP